MTRDNEGHHDSSSNRTESHSTDELFEANVGILTRIARQRMGPERRDHILEPQALVNEAFVRLAKRSRLPWASNEQFMRVVSREMSRVLIDFARKRNAHKNGGRFVHLELDETSIGCAPFNPQRVTLRDAMMVFRKAQPRAFESIRLRSIIGLSVSETSRATGFSERTVKRDLRIARRWLSSELAGTSDRLLPRSGS